MDLVGLPGDGRGERVDNRESGERRSIWPSRILQNDAPTYTNETTMR